MVSKLERDYQMELIPRIYDLFPEDRPLVDVLVYITDPNYIQGIPDLLVVRHNNWAMLEVKLSEKSKEQPNQRWYVENWGRYVFTSFIYPENEREVLLALQSALAGRR
jgi:hypothetical protein